MRAVRSSCAGAAAAVALAGLFAGPPARPEVAHRVADLRTEPTSTWRFAGWVGPLGDEALLTPSFSGLGREPWRSDGTGAGTRLVRDLWPGLIGSGAEVLADLGSVTLLVAATPETGAELWRTDGTGPGTRLVLDLLPGARSSVPRALGVLDGALIFAALDDLHGIELWRSDGTTPGTWFLGDLDPGTDSGVCGLGELGAVFQGELFFCGRASSSEATLYATDGTPGGLRRVVDPPTGESAQLYPTGFLATPQGVFFSGEDAAHGRELWLSDGTAAGTRRVLDLYTGSFGSYPVPAAPTSQGLVFLASGADHSVRPWVTDGTEAGTTALIAPGVGSAGWRAGWPVGDRVLFFFYTADAGSEPWITDGTPAGTAILRDIDPGTGGSIWGPSAVEGPGGLYFCADDELWRTDGTGAGTELVVSLGRCEGIESSAIAGSTLVLESRWWEYCGPHSECDYYELWRSDGSAAGTWRLRPSLFEISASDPRELTARAGGLVFTARGDAETFGWIRRAFGTDGTASGTAELRAGDGTRVEAESGFARLPSGELALRGDHPDLGTELWRTDGGALQVIRDLEPGPGSSWPSHPVAFDGRVLFEAAPSATGAELYRTDGTAGGTALVLDIEPNGDAYPEPLAVSGSRAWFAAGDLDHGRELWETQGTAGSTIRHDLTPGPDGTDPRSLQALDPALGSVVFTVGKGLFGFGPGWSDAQLLRTRTWTPELDEMREPPLLGGRYHFIDAGGPEHCELWATDGTTAGTFLVATIGSGWDYRWTSELTCPDDPVVFDSRLFFTACDPAIGCELWTSDGSASGTGPFADLQPGARSFLPRWLTPIDDRLYFSGCRGLQGCEPWLTDGSPAGTHRVADVARGVRSSEPSGFTRSGDLVYFAADDGTGTELWAMPVEIFYDGFETGDVSRWSPPTWPRGR